MKTELLYHLFITSSGVSTDTRNIHSNCLFFALKGDNFNGNSFTIEALNKGAFRVIIDEAQYHQQNGKTILVDNVLKTLQELAKFHRQQLNLPIIALTGSNGKTTTKELIATVLSQKYKTVATLGNLNNHIGVPLTLLSMDKTTEIGIVEMGANHPNEIAFLCEIANPDYGYITNFGKAHLEGFGSVEGVIKAKTELYRHLLKNDKTIFINAEDPLQILHSQNAEKVSFGIKNHDYNIQLKSASNTLLIHFKNLDIQSNLIGAYNFSNMAAAIAMGSYFEVPATQIKTAIESYIPSNNRSQLLEKNGNKIILDAYNANPSSMMAALENFKQAEGTHKIVILGDMFELGEEAKSEHQNLVNYLIENQIGKAFLIGKNFFKTESSQVDILKFETFETFKTYLEKAHFKNNFILIKASRGMALERVLQLL